MWTIYFIDILQNLSCLASVSLFCALFITFVSGGVSFSEQDTAANSIFKVALTTSICCALLLVFIPDKKTMYLMVGAYAVERVVETPEAKEFGNKLLKIANNKLDELAKETK
jgi:MFS-type transporter involved in bile tolerance (Atg22 family)